MNLVHPNASLETESVCPITGLPVVSRPEWTNRTFGGAFRLTTRVIGDRIIFNRPSGEPDLQDIIGSIDLIDEVMRDHIDTSAGCVSIADYSGMRGISHDARKYYIRYMERQASMLGYVYFNVNTHFRIIIKLAKRLSTARINVQIAEDYRAAITECLHLIRGGEARSLSGRTAWNQAGALTPSDRSVSTKNADAAVGESARVVGQLLSFIGDINWEHYGITIPDPVDDDHPFRPVFDAIVAIKGELDALLRERRSTEKALRASQQCFEEVLNHSRDILFKRNLQTGAYEYLSEAVSDVLGVPTEAACRTGFEGIKAFIHPDDLPQFIAFHKKLQESGDPESNEHLIQYRLRDRHGNYRWMSGTATVIRDARGKPAFVIGSNRDVSHIKALETERQAMTEQLLRSRKLEAVSTMAGGVAHNFNNLLMVVLGNLELMRMDVAPDAPLSKHIDAAEKSARRAAHLSTLMLTYVGQAKISAQTIDLNVALSEMVDVLKTTVAGNATLSLAGAPCAAWIHADSGKLFQMVSNLVANAVEACGVHPLEIHLGVGVQHFDAARLNRLVPGEQLPAGSYVFLEVSDNGCGMDSETLDKVFDPFFTTKFTGRGLGMAAVMGIMRAHHGGVHIDSRMNGGTTVTAYFPAHQQEKRSIAVPMPAADGKRRTVLLVDDEPSVLELGQQMLRRLGCDVLTAVDGIDALSVYEANRNRIHLVVLDIEMPRMDGRQTLVRLRETGARFPVLVASGFIEAQAREKLSDVPVEGFIQKPFLLNQLQEKIDMLLRSPIGPPAQ